MTETATRDRYETAYLNGFNLQERVVAIFEETQYLDPFNQLFPDKPLLAGCEVPVPAGPLEAPAGYGAVVPGMPNPLGNVKPRHLMVQPAYYRRGGAFDDLAFEALVGGAHQMLGVLKGQLLRGGIDLEDSETGVSLKMSSGIPDASIHRVPTTPEGVAGYVTGTGHKRGLVLVHEDQRDAFAAIMGLFPLDVQVCFLEDDIHPAMWPANAVTFIAGAKHRPVGRTWHTTGENPYDATSIWVRVKPKGTLGLDLTRAPDDQPPTLDVDYIQVGLAALPVLDRPEDVYVFTLI